MMQRAISIGYLSLFLLAMLVDAAPMPDALEHKVDQFVAAEMQQQKIPGVAVGVFKAGEPILMKGYGYANVEHHAPVSPASVYHSASIGKQFAAVAIMLLVEDGKLALDSSIRTYFPDAPESWQGISVRHLLTHTSGIADYFEAMGTNGIEAYDGRRDCAPDELRKIFYTLPLIFAAGSDYSYSNTGYALLGFLIQRVTGRFYGDELRDRIFTPRGMSSAEVVIESDIVPNRVASYELIAGEWKNQHRLEHRTIARGALVPPQRRLAWIQPFYFTLPGQRGHDSRADQSGYGRANDYC